MNDTEELLKVKEVAQLCKISVSAIYRAIGRGELKASNLGNRKAFRILTSEMWIWIKNNERKQ